MARFEKRRKMQSLLYNRTTVVILAVVTVLLGFSAFSVFQKREEAYQNAKTAEYQVKTLTEREQKTQEEINELQTNEGVEAAIRDEYQASKDGEGLVVVVDPATHGNATFTPQESVAPSWWHRLLAVLHL